MTKNQNLIDPEHLENIMTECAYLQSVGDYELTHEQKRIAAAVNIITGESSREVNKQRIEAAITQAEKLIFAEIQKAREILSPAGIQKAIAV